MIVYRDMCFCDYWEGCKDGEGCIRALTQDVWVKAESIGLPVDRFMENPICFKEKAND